MFAPLTYARRRAVVACCGTLGLLAGCDTAANQSDKQAREDVRNAQAAAQTGKDVDPALQRLESLASNNDVRPSTRLAASAMLGRSRLTRAREALLNVDRMNRDAQRLAMEIAQLAGQVQLANQLAIGYKLFDPLPVVNNLKKQADEARGTADRAVWFSTAGLDFKSLSAVSQELSKLEGQAAELQQKIDGLQAQRDALLARGEQSATQAETTAGRESVDAFKQASDSRKQAADLAAQIDAATAELNRVKADVSILAGRKDFVTAAAAQLDEEGSLVETNWAVVQKSAGVQQKIAERIASGTGDVQMVTMPDNVDLTIETLPGGSITEKAAKLKEILSAADAAREQAAEMLIAAGKHFEDAIRAADEGRSEIEKLKQENPGASQGQRDAWDASRNALSAAAYRVDRAEALRLLGGLHANHAAMLEVRLQLQAMIESSYKGMSLSPPDSLTDSQLHDQYDQAIKEADEQFRLADEQLETVAEAGKDTHSEKSAATAAQIGRIFGLYRWSMLAAEMQQIDQARQHLDLAKNLVADAVERKIVLPVLPADLQPPPPASQPAEGSAATAPSDSSSSQPPQTPVEQPAQTPATAPAETPPSAGPG